MITKLRWMLLFTSLFVLLFTAPTLAQLSVQRMQHVMAQRLTVNTTSTLTGNVSTGADLTVGDDATVVDDLTTGDLFATQTSSQTITAGGTITPTGMYHQITASAARGTSSVAGVATAGRVVLLVNVGSSTITLTDTGTLKLSGNAALGQYDSLMLLSDGTNWIQLGKTDN